MPHALRKGLGTLAAGLAIAVMLPQAATAAIPQPPDANARYALAGGSYGLESQAANRFVALKGRAKAFGSNVRVAPAGGGLARYLRLARLR